MDLFWFLNIAVLILTIAAFPVSVAAASSTNDPLASSKLPFFDVVVQFFSSLFSMIRP
jgi:hypothetical protein